MSGPDPQAAPTPRRPLSDADAPNPLFLEHASYRQRRLRDALRMLPVLGAVLWVLPLFRSGPDGAGPGNAEMLVYIFVVWIGLIVLAGLLSRKLRFDTNAEPRDGDGKA